MKILFALVILALYTLQAQGQNNFATCGRAWTKIGCFKDSGNRRNRVLPELLLNDRDEYSRFHEQGYRFDWYRFHESTHSLACRCAEKARQKNYKVFGLQFWGECWSGQNGDTTFNRSGIALDKRCSMNLPGLGQPTECVQSSAKECVGKHWTNYVYELKEDGCENPGIDVGIILDSSGSVRRHNYEKAKDFLIDLVDKMHVANGQTHVGFIHYDRTAHLDWNFKSDVARNIDVLKARIKEVPYRGGGTRTDMALRKAWSELFNGQGVRDHVPHVLLVITDGKTNAGSEEYKVVLQPLKSHNVKVIAIGVGFGIDGGELLEIACGKSDNVVRVHEFSKFVSRIQKIFDRSCFP